MGVFVSIFVFLCLLIEALCELISSFLLCFYLVLRLGFGFYLPVELVAYLYIFGAEVGFWILRAFGVGRLIFSTWYLFVQGSGAYLFVVGTGNNFRYRRDCLVQRILPDNRCLVLKILMDTVHNIWMLSSTA